MRLSPVGMGRVSPTAHGLLDSVERFDPRRRHGCPRRPLLSGRAQGGVYRPSWREGTVLIWGGRRRRRQHARFSRALFADEWLHGDGLHEHDARRVCLGVAVDGRVFVAGGFDVPGTGKLLSSAEIYNRTTGTWSGAGDMTAARFESKATLLADGRVLITGGSAVPAAANVSGADVVTSSAEIYSP